MTSKEKLNSIESLINEFYHDMKCKGNLNDCANECWKEYQEFCEDIEQDLELLETLISVLQKFKDEEYFDLDNTTLGMDGRINLTQEEYDLLKECL